MCLVMRENVEMGSRANVAILCHHCNKQQGVEKFPSKCTAQLRAQDDGSIAFSCF
jgi:hypothetical protein